MKSEGPRGDAERRLPRRGSATPEGRGSVGPGARGLPGRSMRAARSAVSRERNGSFSNSQAVLGRASRAARDLARAKPRGIFLSRLVTDKGRKERANALSLLPFSFCTIGNLDAPTCRPAVVLARLGSRLHVTGGELFFRDTSIFMGSSFLPPQSFLNKQVV